MRSIRTYWFAGSASIRVYRRRVIGGDGTDPRRARIADAVLDLVAERGLEEASIRHVAARAGVSVGMVQHHFRTKDELMQFALERVSAEVQRRLSAGAGSARELLGALYEQLMPLDEQRRRESRVALAFLAYATIRPEASGRLREDARLLRDHLAAQWGPSPIAAPHGATAALALIDGLGVQVVSGQLAVEAATAAFDAVLDWMLPPAPVSRPVDEAEADHRGQSR